MKIVSQNPEYSRQIEDLYKLYGLLGNIPAKINPRFTIKITPEFQEDLYLHSHEKEKLEMDKFGIPGLNGVVIMPKTEELDFIVLISSKQFEDDQVVHTAFHEFTHLYDYFQYFQENGNLYIRDEKEQELKYFWEFYQWSEYHAKRLGTFIFSIYQWYKMHGAKPPPDGKYLFQYAEFRSKDLVEKIDEFRKAQKMKLHNTNYLFWDLFQELMGYYGRFSVFQKEDLNKYPDEEFPKETLIDTLGQECIELYHLLLQMKTYDTAKTRLKEIKELKESILSTVNIRAFFHR